MREAFIVVPKTAMSRSRKKAPFAAVTTAKTDKPWKKQAAKIFRRATKQKLAVTQDGDALPIHRYELVSQYSTAKDGKKRLTDPKSPRLRK